MLFTFLGKITAALSILGGVVSLALIWGEFTGPGRPPLDPTNPMMAPLFAVSAMAACLIIFGLLLGVFCEISSNIRRIKLTASQE